MKRFILGEAPDKDGLVRIRGAAYHYLVHVRRLKKGGVFPALLAGKASPGTFGGPGVTETAVSVTVVSVDGNVLTGKCEINRSEDTALNDSEMPCRCLIPPLILFQALPRSGKMDLIVRQAAEGGISEVVPFVSARSAAGESRREERWRRIVKEARQQSGSAVDTQVRPVLAEDALFGYWDTLRSAQKQHGQDGADKADKADKADEADEADEADKAAEGGALGIIFHPGPAVSGGLVSDPLVPRAIPPVSPLAQCSFHHYLNKKPAAVVLAVGPEGGFTGAELERFIQAGFKPLQMGDTVLRTETAALYGAAAVRIILMEGTWWTLK